MATSSTLVTVRQAVVDVLAARTNIVSGSVQVTYSWPRNATRNEAIFTAPPVDADTGIPVMRATRHKRQEDYTFDVIVQVVHPGTVKQANTRAFELMAELDNALADDPRLGLSGVIDSAVIGGWELIEGVDDVGSGSRLNIHLDIAARLA